MAATPKPVRKVHKARAMKMAKEHKESVKDTSKHHVKKHAMSIAKGKVGFFSGRSKKHHMDY